MNKGLTGTSLPNYAKQTRYARSHERLKLALEHGFFIEAAMICESVIADRLHSNLHWRVAEVCLLTLGDVIAQVGQEPAFRKRRPDISLEKPATLAVLIAALRVAFDDFGNERYVDLPRRLDQWRAKRNKITHNVIYTVPTRKTYQEDFDAFMKTAEECAAEGKVLANLLHQWDRMARRRTANRGADSP